MTAMVAEHMVGALKFARSAWQREWGCAYRRLVHMQVGDICPEWGRGHVRMMQCWHQVAIVECQNAVVHRCNLQSSDLLSCFAIVAPA